jgi:hypothetical protein
MHLLILWNSVQTSKEIQKYLTIVNIKNSGHVISRSEKRVKHIVLIYNVHPSCKIKNLDKILCIMHKKYGTQLFQNISYFELLVNQFR